MGIGIDFTRPSDNTESPLAVPVQERVRRLPEAVLLMTGYYASRVPPLRTFLRRLD